MEGDGIRNVARQVALAIAATAVGACGGGGGGGDDTPSPDLALTAADRDTVAHAAAISFLAFDVVGALPLQADGAAVGRESAAGAARATTGLTGNWLPRVLDALSKRRDAARREHSQAVIGPAVENCSNGGTLSLTIDDHDNDDTVSVGDTFTFVFGNCREGSDLVNGSMSLTFLALGATSAPSFQARLGFSQLSDEADDGRHRITLDGPVHLDYVQQSSSVESYTLTAIAPVQATVYTHAFGTDTVTMQSGYRQQSTFDAGVPAPADADGTMPGRTSTTLEGRIHSQRAAGAVSLSTPSGPVLHYAADVYPRAGVLRIKGRTGLIDLTVLSAASIRIDLDVNDDNVVDSTYTGTWDWLL